MESIDETLKLLAHARDIAERMKERDEEQARDRQHLDHVLRRLSGMRGGGFERGFRIDLPGVPKVGEVTARATLANVEPPSVSMTVLRHTQASAPPGVTPPPPEPAEEVSKYDVIYHLIASGRFDLGMAARAIYSEDSERSRNRVRAGVNHLRERGLVMRHPDGSYTAVRRKPIPSAEAFAGKREG